MPCRLLSSRRGVARDLPGPRPTTSCVCGEVYTASPLQVLAARYNKIHSATAAELRPWWQRDEAGAWCYTLQRKTRTAEQWRAALLASQSRCGELSLVAHPPPLPASVYLYSTTGSK